VSGIENYVEPGEFISVTNMRNENKFFLFAVFLSAASLTPMGSALPAEMSGVSMSSGAAPAPASKRRTRHLSLGKHPLAAMHRKSRLATTGVSWGAVAISMENDGVSSGYARRSTPAAAINDAIEICSGTGRPGCYAPKPAFTSCIYVAISANGSSYSAWGTGSTPVEALNNCQSQGVNCQTPTGGC
jgi:hypothetical protein